MLEGRRVNPVWERKKSTDRVAFLINQQEKKSEKFDQIYWWQIHSGLDSSSDCYLDWLWIYICQTQPKWIVYIELLAGASSLEEKKKKNYEEWMKTWHRQKHPQRTPWPSHSRNKSYGDGDHDHGRDVDHDHDSADHADNNNDDVDNDDDHDHDSDDDDDDNT